jgi:two-component system sensor kinase FixL
LLDKAASQSLRAGQIIRRLRDFIEKREDNRAKEDVNKVIEEAMALAFVGAADAGVTVTARLGANLPLVMIDKIQIQQVVLNLVRNALEAMAGCERRELSLVTRQEDERFIEVAASDTGPGLSEEVAAKLFQPFVTTKDDGMGIGLSICRSIVDAHGGKLWATPNAGGGVTFRFQLPVAESEDEEKASR